MPIYDAPRYITLTDMRRYISAHTNSLSTDEDDLLTDCIVSAEWQIDTYTRRTFVAEPGTRYYSRFTAIVQDTALYLGEGDDLFALPVDGTVYNGDGQIFPVGSIWLEPRGETGPFRILRLKSSYAWSWNTDDEIKIPGTWGWSLFAPPPIQSATRELAMYIYRSKDVTPNDMAGFDQAGVVQSPRGMPETVRRRIEPYRSRSGGVL